MVYSAGDPRFTDHASNWQTQISNDGGTTACGSSSGALTPGITVDVNRDCIKAGGTFTATISFTFYGDRHTFTETVSGSTPDAGRRRLKFRFTADFYHPVLHRAQVRVHYSGSYHQDVDRLAALELQHHLRPVTGGGVHTRCGPHPAPDEHGSGPESRPGVRQSAPPSSTAAIAVYTLHVSFTDPNYGVTGGPYDAVAGSRP